MDCPKCLGKLEAKEVRVDEIHDVKDLGGAAVTYSLEFDQCFSCGGVWFDKGELEKYTTEKLTSIDSPSLDSPVDAKFDQKQGKCPRCGIPLNKHPYKKDTSITLDTCGNCGGTWLDSTEIDKIEQAEKPGVLEMILRKLKPSRK